jgi:hypothetical protein
VELHPGTNVCVIDSLLQLFECRQGARFHPDRAAITVEIADFIRDHYRLTPDWNRDMERGHSNFTTVLSNFAWLWMAGNLLPHAEGLPLLLELRGGGADGTEIDTGHIGVHGVPRHWNGQVFAIHGHAQHHVPVWWERDGLIYNSTASTEAQMIDTVSLPDASPAMVHALLHQFQPLAIFHSPEPEDDEGRQTMDRLGATPASHGFQPEERGVFQACLKAIWNDGARESHDYCVLNIPGEYPPIYSGHFAMHQLESESLHSAHGHPKWAIILNTQGCLAARTSYAASRAAAR